MASKKYILIAGLLALLQTASFAQSSFAQNQSNNASDSWVFDSSKVSKKHMPQHSQFMSNAYPYPAKPKSMWELGFGGGLGEIFGDVAQLPAVSGSVTFRKALGHVLSIRGGYEGAVFYGTDTHPRNASQFDYVSSYNPWKSLYPYDKPFFTSYQTKVHSIILDAIFSLNALNQYRGNPKADWYLLVGYVAQGAHVGVAAENPATGNGWDFSSLLNNNAFQTMSSLDIQKAVKNIEDAPLHAKYDQVAPISGYGQRYNVGYDWFGIKHFQINHGLSVGGGVAFRITDRYNIGIEQKWVITGNDNLDGVVSGQSADIESYTQVRLNINIGNSATHTLPLWWLNGNNYIYNEVNAPKHMKMPPVVLPDADGDGVTDQFDLEPNTPKGCAVDTHGVSLDTDGDGVPDCKDKEKLTPQSCFPVDADGVGKCPEPPCCDSLSKALATAGPKTATCAIGSLPSITFKGSSVTISKSAEALLSSAAAQINANPGCKVKVIGYGVSSKAAQQLSWDRVNAVINYLVTKQGISENRFIFTYGQSGDANTVDLQGSTEEGPNTVPAPHPNLEKKK